MMLFGPSTAQQCKLLSELIRILELRIDNKRREVDQYREVKNLREHELMEQNVLCEIADKALIDRTTSIAAARVTALVPRAMLGLVSSQRSLLKHAKTMRNEVKIATKHVVEAQHLLEQKLRDLNWLQARQKILESVMQTLQKNLVIHQNLLEDTLQDDDYASYLSAKMHWGRQVLTRF
jgi:hypothetical protein